MEQLRNCLQNGRVDRNALIKDYNLLKLEVRKVCPSEYTATSNKQRPDQHMKFYIPSYILSTYIAGKAVLHKEFRITSLGVFKFFSCYLATNKGISILFLDECDIIAIQLYKERTALER